MKKEFREVDRKSKVKMYKSGKKWVAVILNQLSLLRIMGGKVSEIRLSNREIQKNDNEFTKNLLRGLMAISAITATADNQTVISADEIAVEKESASYGNYLIGEDSIVLSISSESNGDITDNSESFSVSDSISISQSKSISKYQSDSQRFSELESSQVSESASFSHSLSYSTSHSSSHSLAFVSSSESDTQSQSSSLESSSQSEDSSNMTPLSENFSYSQQNLNSVMDLSSESSISLNSTSDTTFISSQAINIIATGTLSSISQNKKQILVKGNGNTLGNTAFRAITITNNSAPTVILDDQFSQGTGSDSAYYVMHVYRTEPLNITFKIYDDSGSVSQAFVGQIQGKNLNSDDKYSVVSYVTPNRITSSTDATETNPATIVYSGTVSTSDPVGTRGVYTKRLKVTDSSGNVTNVDFKVYIHALTENILRSHQRLKKLIIQEP